LLASDGSDEARSATRWLRDLPLPSDTKICVLVVATLTKPPRDGQSLKQLRRTSLRPRADVDRSLSEREASGYWNVFCWAVSRRPSSITRPGPC
jgi:hypothetical protein